MNPAALRQFAALARTLPQPERAQIARNAIIRVLAGQISPLGDEERLDDELARRYAQGVNGGMPRGFDDRTGQGADAAPGVFIDAASGAFAPPGETPLQPFMRNPAHGPAPLPDAFRPAAAGAPEATSAETPVLPFTRNRVPGPAMQEISARNAREAGDRAGQARKLPVDVPGFGTEKFHTRS